MKAFLAIEIPNKVKQQIEEQIASFKKNYPQFNWVQPGDYRLVLYNFEELEDKEEVIKRLEDAVFEIRPFTLHILGVDLFLTDKIVIYLHFYKEKMLNSLAERIYEAVYETDKGQFIPQINLAQHKIPSKQQYLLIRKKLENLPIEINFPVSKISLQESVIRGKKPVYKKLAEFTFIA
jgi:2'-5' RNA ligase